MAMRQGIGAGVAYFAIIFTIGFLLGTIRVLLVIPAFGEWPAILLELPVMVVISWLACGWVIRRYAIRPAWQERIAMAIAAFLLLMGMEFGLAVTLFGQTPSGYAADLAAPLGLAGLAGQFCFALFPLWRMR